MIKYFYVFEIEEDAKKNRRKRWMVHSLASTDSEEWHAKESPVIPAYVMVIK